jgi:RNA polymerase sigma factor (sigma-70 family)
MKASMTSPLLNLIRRVAEDPRIESLTDQELLARFRAERDEAAFRGMVRRHGPMVLDVCRNVLGNEADAEDGFQATFLVLTQKSGTIRKEESIGSWLDGVAYRIALKARKYALRRSEHEARCSGQRPVEVFDDLSWREVREALYAALSLISECYRAPLVLCYLEGKTQDQAAVLLGVSRATVKNRLERGRALLRTRLVRSGLGPAAMLAMAVWPQATTAAPVRSFLIASTVRAAGQLAAGHVTAAASVSANVVSLTQGALNAMFLNQLKTVALLVVGLLATGGLISGVLGLPSPAVPALAAHGPEKTPARGDPVPKGEPAGDPGARNGPAVVKADAFAKGGKRVTSLAYCNDGKAVAVVIWRKLRSQDTQESSVVVWDLQKGKVEQTLEKFDEGTSCFLNVTASTDGKTIAATSQELGKPDVAIKVWEAKTGKLVQTLTHEHNVNSIALSPDGKKLVGCAHLNHVLVWDVESGNRLKTLDTKDMNLWSVALSEDGKLVAAGGEVGELTGDGKVVVWELETGKVKHELTTAQMGTVGRLVFSPDGKTVTSAGGNEDTIRVWNMKSGELKQRLGGHAVYGLAISPDGKMLASAGDDRKVIVWDVAQEKQVATFEGHSEHDKGNFVSTVKFAPDGRSLASGSWDGTMRLWRLPQPKK